MCHIHMMFYMIMIYIYIYICVKILSNKLHKTRYLEMFVCRKAVCTNFTNLFVIKMNRRNINIQLFIKKYISIKKQMLLL